MNVIAGQHRDAGSWDPCDGSVTSAPNVRIWYDERTFMITASPSGLKGLLGLLSNLSDGISLGSDIENISNDSGWVDTGLNRTYNVNVPVGIKVDLDRSTQFQVNGGVSAVMVAPLMYEVVQRRYVVQTTRYNYEEYNAQRARN
jgi:hypothetical protein